MDRHPPRILKPLVAGLALWTACSDLPTAQVAQAPTPAFGLIEVDPETNNSRTVARNRPDLGSVWGSLAQSFTAEDPAVVFGFRLWNRGLDGEPVLGQTVIYRLYEGDNDYANLLATRQVDVPTEVVRDPFGDVGFVEVDFAAVTLSVGERYTVEITVPDADQPALGESTPVGVWTALDNPYPGGRFYFPSGLNNAFWVDHDMLFRVTPISLAEQFAAAVTGLVADGSLNQGQGNALLQKFDQALSHAAAGRTRTALNVIGALSNQIQDLVATGVLTVAQGQTLTDLTHAWGTSVTGATAPAAG